MDSRGVSPGGTGSGGAGAGLNGKGTGASGLGGGARSSGVRGGTSTGGFEAQAYESALAPGQSASVSNLAGALADSLSSGTGEVQLASASGFDTPLPPLAPATGGLSISPAALQVGDIIISTTSHNDSLAVRLATRAPVSHATLFVGSPDRIVEALAQGVVENSIAGALSDDSLAVAFRVRELTLGQAQLAADYAISQVGKKYDYWNAFTAAVPWWGPLVSPVLVGPILRRIDLGKRDSTFFCSELVIESFRQAGRPLTVAPSNEVLPGDIPRLKVDYVGHLKY